MAEGTPPALDTSIQSCHRPPALPNAGVHPVPQEQRGESNPEIEVGDKNRCLSTQKNDKPLILNKTNFQSGKLYPPLRSALTRVGSVAR